MNHTTTPALNEEKKIFRARALAARDSLPEELRREKSDRIISRLFDMPEVENCDTWFVYVAFRSEVHTRGLIQQLLAAGKSVCVPRIDPDRRQMTACRIADPERDLVPGFYGIAEPARDRLQPVDAAALDVAIVPGAAFSQDGFRIGYGGGFYDRFLINCPALAIGLAFDEQIAPRVPCDPGRDIPLACIVTESRLIRCKG